MRDYYLEIGVKPSDNLEEIRKVFTKQQRHIFGKTDKEQAAFFEAWKVLQDEDKRKEYDEQPQFQLKKTSNRLTAGSKKKGAERQQFRWGIPLMEILKMPFQKQEEVQEQTPEEKANIHFTQGILYSGEVSKFTQAKEEFKEVLNIIPDLEEGLYNYAIMCYKLGQFKEALECFKNYSSQYPKDLYAKKMITLLE